MPVFDKPDAVHKRIKWTHISSSLPPDEISSPAYKGGTLFACVLTRREFFTTNSGQNRIQSTTGLTNSSINAFTVSGSNIFAGSNSYEGGIFLSLHHRPVHKERRDGAHDIP